MVLAISRDGSVQRHLTALFRVGVLPERWPLGGVPNRTQALKAPSDRLRPRRARAKLALQSTGAHNRRLKEGVTRGVGCVEPEAGVNDSGSFIDTPFIDDHRDLDFGGGDHLDIDFRFAQEFEHPGRNAGMRSHSDPDHAEFRDASLSCKPTGAYFCDDRTKMLLYFR